ncbi:MAG: sugar phosphate isomerase/epimerase [Lachnospiraceae bacterium]|nr:sugar phosphate isomerase/epimerase [Lachnospiraceae bacterium]
MRKELGLQLYTIRDFMKNEKDIHESFQKMRKYGYTQAQTAGCMIPYADFGRIAREEGIEIVGTHDNFNMMVNDFEQSLENHKLLGTTNMGLGMMKFDSIDDVKDFIEKVNIVAEKAGKHGMKFTYHNHSQEFYRWENGKTTMDMLVEGFDPQNTSFVLDTYWVQYGGGDIRHWIEKLKGRIDILHLKDMKRIMPKDNEPVQQITEIGNGNLSWDRIFETAQESGVKYYVVEQDYHWEIDCFESIKTSADYLRKNIF